MSDASPLPGAAAVRDLLCGLLDRDVDVLSDGVMVDPAADAGALVGVYVDARLRLRAVVLTDLALAAYLGAAIGLVPAAVAHQAVELRMLPPALAENAAETLNVTASLFNADDAPHLRLDTVHLPGEALPADVAQWVLAYVRRTDLAVSVPGYGRGRWSLLVV